MMPAILHLPGPFRLAAMLSLCLLTTACELESQGQHATQPVSTNPEPAVIASVAGRDITLAETERAAPLQLYDLDMQRYRLLRNVLEADLLAEIDTRVSAQRVAEIHLQPPAPPLLPVRPDPDRTRPAGAYPIEVVAFCNLESPHCSRLQAQLSHILPLYPAFIQYAERDLVLPFHQYAELAARAGNCALEQGSYWPYRDFMLAGSGAPDRQRILAAGRAVGLAMQQFENCLDTAKAASRLQADHEMARALGVNAVPAVFVNGRYAGNNPESGQLLWLIDSELERLGVDSPRMVAAEIKSGAAYKVDALLTASSPGLGLVALIKGESPAPEFYREGGSLGAGMTIRRVLSDRVEILNRGIPEWIDFTGPGAAAPEQAPVGNSDEISPAGRAALQYPHRAVPVILDRTEVLVRMSDVAALEASLDTVPLKAGEFHLLKVTEVEPGGLYELLGLEPGDVIVAVNERAMHEGEKPLWHALQTEQEVRLRVVRQGGLAHHYTYRFSD